MSAKVDEERKADRRAEALLKFNALVGKCTRIAKLWAEGKSDAEIGLAVGLSEVTVSRYRQFFGLWSRQGSDVAGRWRERL